MNGFGSGGGLDRRLAWTNEPRQWSIADTDALLVSVDGGTNFWQRTRHGRRADDGHFLGTPVSGDFDMEVSVVARPRAQYDQAGLMVRVSDESWLKTSAEYETEERSLLGAVVTNCGWSDWSSHEVSDTRLRFRVRRRGADFLVHARRDGEDWIQLRVAHLFAASGSVTAGVYACSPVGLGFEVRFDRFRLAEEAPDTHAD